MATTTTTIRASAKVSDAGFTGTKLSDGTTPSVLSSINDNSDNTYARKPASGSAYEAVYALADPSPSRPSASEFVWYVQQNTRLFQGSNGYLWVGGINTSGAAHCSQLLSGAYGSSKSITSYSRTAGSATVTVSTGTVAHGLSSGDAITIEGMTAGAGLNGSFTVLATGLTTTGFQYTSSATTAQSGSTGTVIKPQTVSQTFNLNALNASGGYLWDSTTLNALRLDFVDSGTSAARARIYDVWFDIVTTPLPTVSITDIDGDNVAPYSVANTTRPVLNFTYSQADLVAQNGAQVRVFTSSKSDPTNDTNLVWDSGVLGNVSSVTIGSPTSAYPSGVDLANGTTYYAYVRVGATPSGSSSTRVWSAWGSGTGSSTITFSVSLTAPTAPTITTTGGSNGWDATNAKATLTLTGASFATGSQTFTLQRSNDGGTTWTTVRGGDSQNATAAGVTPTAWVFTDYEAERGTTSSGKTVKYRARANGTLTSGGASVASAWTTVNLATTNSGTWVLRSFTDTVTPTPAFDLIGARVLTDVTIKREEAVGVFRPLGRNTAVVVHGDLEGRDGDWNIVADSTDWTTLEGVLNGQKIVLVCDPFGGHRYVRITSREYTLTGGAASPRYEVTTSYVEVGSDTSTGS